VQIPKVLLVNDDAASLFALESPLMGAPGDPEYQLITAACGDQALRPVPAAQMPALLQDAVQATSASTSRKPDPATLSLPKNEDTVDE
jgi:hypothetical protein